MPPRAFAALVATVLLGACDAPRAPTSQATFATLIEGCTDCGLVVQATVELRDHADFPIGLPTDMTYRAGRIEVRPGTRSGAIINGRLVVAGRPLDPDERSTLHHIDDEGKVIRSVLELVEHPLDHVHSIEPLPNGDLLVGRYWDRSIFVVGSGESGNATMLSERPEWFEPVAPRRLRRVAESGRIPPPYAALRDIAVDSVGVLWALSQFPRDDWRERAGVEDNPPPDARVRAVIEALDSATGEVLGHLEVDAFPVLLARGGEVVLFETLETGLPSVVLADFRSK